MAEKESLLSQVVSRRKVIANWGLLGLGAALDLNSLRLLNDRQQIMKQGRVIHVPGVSAENMNLAIIIANETRAEAIRFKSFQAGLSAFCATIAACAAKYLEDRS